jgi:hypothetical protein
MDSTVSRAHLGGRLAAVGGVVALVGCLAAPVASAAPPGAATGAASGDGSTGTSGLTMERIDRGLVAATASEGVSLSWRLLAREVTGATATGPTGPAFAVYGAGTKVATVTDSTNYLDTAGSLTGR